MPTTTCAVCKRDLGWDTPSGVCSIVCLNEGQGFTVIPSIRAETIASLLAIRASAAADLAVMPSHKDGSEWARDRYRDIAWCNRQLERMGIGPEEANRLASESMTEAQRAWEEAF